MLLQLLRACRRLLLLDSWSMLAGTAVSPLRALAFRQRSADVWLPEKASVVVVVVDDSKVEQQAGKGKGEALKWLSTCHSLMHFEVEALNCKRCLKANFEDTCTSSANQNVYYILWKKCPWGRRLRNARRPHQIEVQPT